VLCGTLDLDPFIVWFCCSVVMSWTGFCGRSSCCCRLIMFGAPDAMWRPRSGGVTHSNGIVSIHSGVGGYLECQQHTVPSCVGAPVSCLAQECPYKYCPKGET
jgi:hypothetical protein